MKYQIIAWLCAIILTSACTVNNDVPYEEVKNYFYTGKMKCGVEKITSKLEYDNTFGMAAFMGKGGEPTSIDFDKEFVIAIINDTTSYSCNLTPVSLVKKKNTLSFTYSETIGKHRHSYQIKPILIIKTSKEYSQLKLVTIKQ